VGAEARSVYFFIKGPIDAALEALRQELRIARIAGYDGEIAASNLVAMELTAGDFGTAVDNARNLLEQMSASRNQLALTLVRLNLSGALLALDKTTEARPFIDAAWRMAHFFGLHGDCADYLALLCALEARWSAAATLVGYANAVHAGRGAQRWPSEMHAHERTVQLVSDALDSNEVQRCLHDGGRLPDAAVAQLAFDER
jgi:hypothetical protein